MLPLLIGLLVLTPAAASPPTAATEAARMKTELGSGYHVDVVGGVFVVMSNGPKWLHRRGIGVVRKAYDSMYKDYFRVRPDKPLYVHLFKDKHTYSAFVKRTYGMPPLTPYGFYDSTNRRLVMNVKPGPGTLAHEVVHPFFEHDFPNVPAWFNEGFAALMEHKGYTSDGTMRAYVNWRMKGLRSAMRRGRSVDLSALMKSSTKAFYADGGWTYALARHFLLWLQRDKHLITFFREFRANHREDPTGIATLERVTGESLGSLQRRFVRWLKKKRKKR